MLLQGEDPHVLGHGHWIAKKQNVEGGDSKVSLLNIYVQHYEDTELRSQAKKRWMAARNLRVFGTDNSGKHLCPKEKMPKQIGDEDCSAVLCKEFIRVHNPSQVSEGMKYFLNCSNYKLGTVTNEEC